MIKDKKSETKLYLGCGSNPIKGFINCDIQKLPGVDLVFDCADLSRFETNSVSLIFGNSFFEHLYLYQQAPFLRECFRVLNKDGILIFTGIPDFDLIAQLYLDSKPGLKPFNGVFNLPQVYRLTHGDFEEDGKACIPQMHKTLFNKDHLEKLFNAVDFTSHMIFNYKFPGEQYDISMCVVAYKNPGHKGKNIKAVMRSLSRFFEEPEDIINKF